MFTGVPVFTSMSRKIIEVLSRKGRIFYEGLKNTSFACHTIGHRKDCYLEHRSRNNHKTPSENTTLSNAGVVTVKLVVEERVSSDITEDNIIEILEDDAIEETTDDTTEVDQVQPDVCEAESDDLEEQTEQNRRLT